MHRDTVIGIVGVVILVAAMVGVFTYERGQAADLNGTPGVVTTLTGPVASGNTAVGAETQDVLAFNQTGMTNVTFTLSWTATNGVDTMQLVIVLPDNTTFESDPESDGSIQLTVPVNNTAVSGTAGVGDWQYTVAFVSASTGLPQEPPVPIPGQTDAAVDWDLETEIEALTGSA